MTGAARALDVVAAALAALALAVLATGGFTSSGLTLTRAEDLVVALAGVMALRLVLAPLRLPAVRPERAVAGGGALYVLVMGFIVLTRHAALRTHALDLGYYVQVVWSIAAGHGARVTLPPMHAWGDHLSPVLYGFAPIAWLWPGAAPLLLAQTLILAAGGAAVFAYARRRLGAEGAAVAAGFALLYLLNPSLHGANLRDIHPQAFAMTFVIWAAAALDAGRPLACAAALLLTLAGREDAALAVVGFGLWMALARRRWALGAAVALAALLLLAADLRWVMPGFRGEPYPHLHRFAHLGGSLGEILTTLALRPWRWLPVVLSAEKLLYLGALLAPLAFLPLLAPRALAGALPALAVNLLSHDPVLFHYRSQYQSFVLPFLVLAAVDGWARLAAWAGRPAWSGPASPEVPPRPRRSAPGAALAFAVLASVVLTARTVNDLGVSKWRLSSDARAAYLLMARIPAAVPVSVNERLVPHLATRRGVYIYPAGLPESEWVLDRETTLQASPASGYREVGRGGGWALLRR